MSTLGLELHDPPIYAKGFSVGRTQPRLSCLILQEWSFLQWALHSCGLSQEMHATFLAIFFGGPAAHGTFILNPSPFVDFLFLFYFLIFIRFPSFTFPSNF